MLPATASVRPQSLALSLEHTTAKTSIHFSTPVHTGATSTVAPPYPNALTRKPQNVFITKWVDDILVAGGVIAALPVSLWPYEDNRVKSASARVGQISTRTQIGTNDWWQKRLHGSATQHSRSKRLDEETNVYHVHGLDDSNSWFPESSDYENVILSLEWDRLTLAGFTVMLQNIASDADSFSLTKVPMLLQRIILEVETAASGVSPALFATCLVRKEGRVSARLSVSQLHSFYLSDMLRAYNEMLGDPLRRPSLTAMEGTLYELTAAIARKVRLLADTRFLKLNMTADTIAMCPVLAGGEGALEEQGYGFEGMQTTKGLPYMIDFDPVHTKRVSSTQADYDADCAYVVMMMVFLASIKAQHGHVYRVMANKVIGRSIGGAEISEQELPEDFGAIDVMQGARRARAADKVTAFCALMRGVLPSTAKQQDPSLSTAYSEVASDFADVIREEVFDTLWDSKKPVPFDRDRPLFEQLVKYLSYSTHVDTAIFKSGPAQADIVAQRERVAKVEQRLNAVKVSVCHSS